MIPPGVSGNRSRDDFANAIVFDAAGAIGIDIDADRIGNSDGVGQLHFAAIGQAGGHDVLRDMACHVSGTAIDLRRILAAERAAAVATPAAVGIDDDFAAGQSGITLRSADHEATRGVDVVFDIALDQFLRHARLDDAVDHVIVNFLVRNVGTVLRGNHDGVDPHGTVAVEFHGDLALAIGTQPSDIVLLAQIGEAIENAVGQSDGQRHQFGRVIAGVAEHQSLIAGADIFALGRIFVHALGDVGALAVDASSTAQVSPQMPIVSSV